MKVVYPIIMTQDGKSVLVYIPDFDINTEGEDTAEAIFMARDAIGLICMTYEDRGKELPKASPVLDMVDRNKGAIVTLVDVDIKEYRLANDQRTVRRNVSLPQWLNYRADKAGINVSAVLQKALKAELNI